MKDLFSLAQVVAYIGKDSRYLKKNRIYYVIFKTEMSQSRTLYFLNDIKAKKSVKKWFSGEDFVKITEEHKIKFGIASSSLEINKSSVIFSLDPNKRNMYGKGIEIVPKDISIINSNIRKVVTINGIYFILVNQETIVDPDDTKIKLAFAAFPNVLSFPKSALTVDVIAAPKIPKVRYEEVTFSEKIGFMYLGSDTYLVGLEGEEKLILKLYNERF